MFCFQCQQTAGNTGCVRTGVCGKQPETAGLQDDLIYELIRLASAAHIKNIRSKEKDRLLIDGLFTTLTNVNFDNEAIRAFTTARKRGERFYRRRLRSHRSLGRRNRHSIPSFHSSLRPQRHGRLRSPCHESGL